MSRQDRLKAGVILAEAMLSLASLSMAGESRHFCFTDRSFESPGRNGRIFHLQRDRPATLRKGFKFGPGFDFRLIKHDSIRLPFGIDEILIIQLSDINIIEIFYKIFTPGRLIMEASSGEDR